MDKTDLTILDYMKENGRSTASEISKKIHLSIPAVSERIRKLEESNIIEKFTVKVNREILGYKLLAMIFVSIDETAHIQNFRNSIIEYEEVLECYHIAGEYDYMLKVLVRDTNELEVFLSNRLKQIKGIRKSNTIIALSSLKEELNR